MTPGENLPAAVERGIKIIEEAMIDYVRQHPGEKGRAIDVALGIPHCGSEPFGKTLRFRLRDAGRLRSEEGPRRWFFIAPEPEDCQGTEAVQKA